MKPPIRLNLQPARRPVEETDSWSGSVIGVAVLFILYILVMQFLKMPIIVR